MMTTNTKKYVHRLFKNVSANVKLVYVLLATSYWLMLLVMAALNGTITAYRTTNRNPIRKRATIMTEKVYSIRVGLGWIMGRLNAFSPFSVSSCESSLANQKSRKDHSHRYSAPNHPTLL